MKLYITHHFMCILVEYREVLKKKTLFYCFSARFWRLHNQHLERRNATVAPICAKSQAWVGITIIIDEDTVPSDKGNTARTRMMLQGWDKTATRQQLGRY
jgi:hypothetical protein